MATDAEKRKRLLRVFNLTIYSLIEGLWDLFGESSFATVETVGDRMVAMLEKEAGLELEGEDPNDILMEVVRLLADEVGTMSGGDVTLEDNRVSMACQNCFLREATAWLEEDKVQPFACLPMTVAASALRKSMKARHRVLGRIWDEDTQTCTIQFELIT